MDDSNGAQRLHNDAVPPLTAAAAMAVLRGEMGLTQKHVSQIMTGKATGSPRLLDLIAWGMGCRWRVELLPEDEEASRG